MEGGLPPPIESSQNPLSPALDLALAGDAAASGRGVASRFFTWRRWEPLPIARQWC